MGSRPLVALAALAPLLACNAHPSPVATFDAAPPTLVALSASASASAPRAPVAAAAPAPYDLPADLARRTRAAREALGERAVVHVAAGVFVLAGHAPGPRFDASVKLLEDAVPAFANARFTRLPDRIITIFLLPTDAAYRAFGQDRADVPDPLPRFGYYLHAAREVVIDEQQGIHTLTHEIVHPLVARDFPAAPLWFDEGLGSLFENPTFPAPGEIHGATNWRHAQLVDALQNAAAHARAGDAGEIPRLDALFGMTDDTFHARSAPTSDLRASRELLHYAMARYACQWLDAGDQLWPFYRAWRAGIAEDPSGRAAFRSVVTRTPEEANGDWVRWVLAGAKDAR